MLGRIWRGRVRLSPVEKMERAGVGAAMWISLVSLRVVDSCSGDEGRSWKRLGLRQPKKRLFTGLEPT